VSQNAGVVPAGALKSWHPGEGGVTVKVWAEANEWEPTTKAANMVVICVAKQIEHFILRIVVSLKPMDAWLGDYQVQSNKETQAESIDSRAAP
jgi:hypothetical protein